MLALYEKFRKAVSHRIDPLAETRPRIEWIKWIQDNSTAGFLAAVAPTAHRTIAEAAGRGDNILLKTADGNFYRKNAHSTQWRGPIDGEYRSFSSFHLDSALATAHKNGLKPQDSAMDIFNTLMGINGPRWQIMRHGTEAAFKTLDTDYPAPPRDFTTLGDYLTPRDLATDNPAFAAYLTRNGHAPYRPGRGYAP